MTKKIDPSLHKPRGGARRKGTLDLNPELAMEWKTKLRRVVTQAAGNMGVVKTGGFYTVKEIRAKWGNKAVIEFKSWFESSRLFNQEIADDLTMQFERGRIDKEKFDHLIVTKAFTWVWSLHPERHQEAWAISRGHAEL